MKPNNRKYSTIEYTQPAIRCNAVRCNAVRGMLLGVVLLDVRS